MAGRGYKTEAVVLRSIRFMLDNEIYVLAAGGTEWKTPSFLIPVEEVDEVEGVEESQRAA